uniref:Helitron helicase n=1 Tax=Steinernema glaseri TaxID=37863 RepID=A0A1I8AR22_9BILA
MLLMLNDNDKLRTSEDVDSLVWAELPDPSEYPRLHDIVKKSMIHGPCGTHNPSSPCMKKLKTRCAKRYPMDYCDETVLEENKIPRYRRRASAPHFIGRNGVRMDSQWVVPYNPYLTSKYNAHINVEVCTSVRCVKYLFKYIYKGHDKANLFIVETNAVQLQPQAQSTQTLDHDEIQNYSDA